MDSSHGNYNGFRLFFFHQTRKQLLKYLFMLKHISFCNTDNEDNFASGMALLDRILQLTFALLASKQDLRSGLRRKGRKEFFPAAGPSFWLRSAVALSLGVLLCSVKPGTYHERDFTERLANSSPDFARTPESERKPRDYHIYSNND